MKTEELWKKHSEETTKVEDWFVMRQADFKQALAEHDQEIISKLEEMIKNEKQKEFEIEDMLLFEIHCKVEALTEAINLIKGE